jgi:hypothetical protein
MLVTNSLDVGTLLYSNYILKYIQPFVINNTLSSTRVYIYIKALAVWGALSLDIEVGIAAKRSSILGVWRRLSDQFLRFCACYCVVNQFWSQGSA